ncbi:MAG: tRNA (adenosine(37)-N6)-threonylcarbamoyltransferase complex dimerization subunit type 1 TsaB [Candidatus Hydrogenedentes bacterium]|nr:tRNA (adenosine(37)-N6)-threonylcarbamoyltransferase complex dimerization subunit type 1 TsaB [Candidatus Hydrogenedentota bacterium]
MKILASDTSTSILTVALCEDERTVAETVADCGRSHAERMLTTVDWVLAEAGLDLLNVDMLAVSAGPGSFTGLRVGVATWKGLALAAGLPLVGVPTLDAMARLMPLDAGLVCPLLDAKMGEVFGAVYEFRGGIPYKTQEDMAAPVEVLLGQLTGPVHVLGEGATRYRARIEAVLPEAVFVPRKDGTPRASSVAAEARAMLARGCPADAERVAPVYLRKSQAEETRARAMVRP